MKELSALLGDPGAIQALWGGTVYPSWNLPAQASLSRWPRAWTPEAALPLRSQLPSARLRARPGWGSPQ